MAEYIEREALIDVLAVSHAHHTNSNREAALLDRDIRLIREQSTADVVEVVHGRWEKASDGDGVICSCCGEDFCTIIHETDRFKHCPNCGARMDGE